MGLAVSRILTPSLFNQSTHEATLAPNRAGGHCVKQLMCSAIVSTTACTPHPNAVEKDSCCPGKSEPHLCAFSAL